MRNAINRSMGILLALLVLLAGAPSWGEGTPVDVNTASARELQSVNGIGPAKAQAIVTHREQHGAFQTVDDLKLVRGIGDKLLEHLRPQVTTGAAAADSGGSAGGGSSGGM